MSVVVDFLTAAERAPTVEDLVPDARELRIRKLQSDMEERDEAARRHRASKRAARPPLTSFLDWGTEPVTVPPMLVSGLVPEDGIGFLFGDHGTWKTFTAMSVAGSIATGRPALGDPRLTVSRPRKVLYIAAEGGHGARGRRQAWERWAGVSTSDSLAILPRPVPLNDEDAADEVHALIVEHGFEFMIVDTYHRSTPGTNENDATEFGEVFEVAARVRDERGCGTLFLDHTAAGGGKPRGTLAKMQDSDYLIEAAHDDGRRKLTVRKLKDHETDGLVYPLRHEAVDGEHFPVVVVATTNGPVPGVDVFDRRGDWHAIPTAELPVAVRDLTARGREAAQDLYRVLAWLDATTDEVDGVTRTDLFNIATSGPRSHSRDVLVKGLGELRKAGVVVNVRRGAYVLRAHPESA